MTDLLDKAEVQAGLDRLIAAAHPVSADGSATRNARNPQLVKSMSVSPPIGFGRVRLLRVRDVDLQPCGARMSRKRRKSVQSASRDREKSARTRRVVLISPTEATASHRAY
jgi:Ser-tRNA(Ala) deacylase AlaX